jgi:hypothetical protein
VRRSAALVALILACLAACAGPGRSARPGAAEPGSVIIHVVRRKWHVDVGFAVADLEPPLAQVARRFPHASYLFFGFGDRHYLLAGGRGASNMLGALWPGPALILATAIENTPEQAFGASQALELRVTARQGRAAQAFIWRSIGGMDAIPGGASRDIGPSAPDVEPYAAGPYDDSLYFAATARYSAVHTCNTWVAEVLRAAGLAVRSRFVLFAGQLWPQVRRLADAPPPAHVGAQSQGGGLPF